MLQQIKSYCLIPSEKKLLNKKRKGSESSFKSTEDEINEGSAQTITESYIKNKELIEKVIEVSLENGELFALVQKRMENGKIKLEKIKTKDFKNDNPWALIKFYENNNIF